MECPHYVPSGRGEVIAKAIGVICPNCQNWYPSANACLVEPDKLTTQKEISREAGSSDSALISQPEY